MGRTCFFIFTIGYLALIYTLGIWDNVAQEAELAVAPQVSKTVTLELPPGPDNPRNSEGDFIRLESGDILYVYTKYYGVSGDDHASARLVSRITRNYGVTWSDQDELVLENEGRLNVMSVSLLRLCDNSIALFYLVKETPGDCRPYLRYSYDDGKTWTDRIEIISAPSYNVVNNSRVVLLSNNRILVPVARHAYKGGDVYNYESKATVFCMISDDGGRTWNPGAEVPNSNNIMYQEPGIVELADGRLLMTIRNASGRQYFSYSSDGGETWTESEPSILVSPASPATIKREPGSDNLVAVWNESPDKRNPLTVAILSPDGKNILAKKTLDKSSNGEERGFCYPALFFVDKDYFLVGYCCGQGYWGLNASRISRVRIEDLKR